MRKLESIIGELEVFKYEHMLHYSGRTDKEASQQRSFKILELRKPKCQRMNYIDLKMNVKEDRP